MNFLTRYICLVLLYLAWDLLNFKVFARQLYGDFFRDGITNHKAASAVYLLYPLSIMYLTSLSPSSSTVQVVPPAFVLGVTTYGVYNMTNMATMRAWPVEIATWDTFAGTLVTTLVAIANHAWK